MTEKQPAAGRHRCTSHGGDEFFSQLDRSRIREPKKGGMRYLFKLIPDRAVDEGVIMPMDIRPDR